MARVFLLMVVAWGAVQAATLVIDASNADTTLEGKAQADLEEEGQDAIELATAIPAESPAVQRIREEEERAPREFISKPKTRPPKA